MGIRFACHECGKRLNIKQDLAGKRGVCPACSVKFRIPLKDAEISTAVDAKPLSASAGSDERFTRSPEIAVAPPNQAAVASPAPAATAAGAAAVGDDAQDGQATWYVRPPSGNQYGPASTELLYQWIEEGRVAETALLWRDGWPNWRPASEALPERIGSVQDREASGSASAKDVAAAAANAAARSSAATRSTAAVGAAAAAGSGDAAPPSVAGGRSPGSAPAVAVQDRPRLSGEASVGASRSARSSRRVLLIGLLSAIVVALVGVLLFVANLG